MFRWLFGKRYKKLEAETKKSFSGVKKDFEAVGKWIKHLDERNKQLSDVIFLLREDMALVRDEIGGVREGLEEVSDGVQNKQVFKKLPVLGKQTGVGAVQNPVQTGVQTGNFYEILKGLSSNERLLMFTLANSDMKLSYEDLAMLLGKERSTIRGQINSIRQKADGLIQEMVEKKNGKKRVYVDDSIKDRLAKYAKVRVGKGKKVEEG
jgi:predicted transcriptional regulator